MGKHQPTTIFELLAAEACSIPNSPAISSPERPTLTYEQLFHLLKTTHSRLNELGIGREDRVALVAPSNSAETATVILAIAASATCVPLNPSFSEAEFTDCLTKLEATVLIVFPDCAPFAVQAAKRLDVPVIEVLVHLEKPAGWFTLQGHTGLPPDNGSFPEATDFALVFLTSGSTAKPKLVPSTHAGLCFSCFNTIRVLELSQKDVCLNVLPLFHVHGLVTNILVPLAAGGSVVFCGGFDPTHFLDWLEGSQATWYSVGPTVHQAILRAAAQDSLQNRQLSLRFIRSGSSTLPPRLATELEALFSVPLIEGYGTSEALTVTNTLFPPRLRKPGSVGPTIGPELAVIDESGLLLPTGVVGEVVIRGENVTPSYLHDPEANKATFIEGWFRTGDLGWLDEDGYLFLSGRLTEVINRGGEKVSPQEVDNILMEFPSVLQAATFAVPHPLLGEDVVSAVVLKPQAQNTPQVIREFLFAHLAEYKIPSQVLIVDTLPKGSTGKLQRIGLAERLVSQLTPAYIAPRNELERLIAKVFAEILILEQVGVNDNFFKLGGDSLRGMQVASRLSVVLELPISPVLLFRKPTIAELALAIAQMVDCGDELSLLEILKEVETLPEDAWCQILQQTDRVAVVPMAEREISRRLAELSPFKRELLKQLFHQKQVHLQNVQDAVSATSAGSCPPVSFIEPLVRKGNPPLSFAQHRLWFLDQLKGASATYNIATALRLHGTLHQPSLEKALQEIVCRHETLRTSFVVENGVPVQSIAPEMSITLNVVDLQAGAESERLAQMQNLVTAEVQRPFDLSQRPLLRVTMLKLGSEDYVLVLVLHHIISDGWSMGVLIRELSELYRAFVQGQSSPLPELPIQYADFSVWQRQWLSDTVLKKQLSYWQQQLEGAPALIELPVNRPLVQSLRGAKQSMFLPQRLTQALRALSLQEGTTLFMTLLAAFQTLLYRYTGQMDIVVGSPIANRSRPEIEGLIGFFANMLVLRTSWEGNPTFRELLNRVREVTLGAYEHQDLPFEKLVEELQPERSLSYSLLFQIVFVLQNAPRPKWILEELAIESLEVDTGTAMFDLILSMTETGSGLMGTWEYKTDLFEETSIRRMASHFQTLLEAIVANPDQPISKLPLLTEVEQHQLLVEWNQTQADYPRDKCIHQLFEEQVEHTPNSIAVEYEKHCLTYQQLNEKANQLAHYLQKMGVKPDMPIGICVERSLDIVVGLLGILKAGGTYVPIDPTYPAERLSTIMQDAQVSILLTKQSLAEKLLVLPLQVICLDTGWEAISQESRANPNSNVKPHHLAYVIYTSGSTGKPKGVAVPHQAINQLVLNTNYIQIKPTDRVAQASNTSFDAATFEIWGALLNGARLIGIPQDLVLSPQAFATCIRQQRITILFLTTALFNQLASTVPKSFSSLRYLLFGGETADLKWVKEVLKYGSPQQLLHVYGPTESTTFASWYLVQHVPEGATTLPIGRPLANKQLYILDAHLQPVPVGVLGELHIGGDGLARGYLNCPELTAEKFIANPFNKGSSARLYKTGDLARYLPDGNIEFIGRIDNQVKIRGFRIELGEVETVLSQHSDAKEVVVTVREEQPGDKQLVVYLVSSNPSLSASELRDFLKQKLPEYMVPSVFVFLDALPINRNGKVDRRALPVPDTSSLQSQATCIPPRTCLEERLVNIWSEVLGTSAVGIYDNFFDLGGHSLLVARMVDRINQHLRTAITIGDVFRAPTIAELATNLSAPKDRVSSYKGHFLELIRAGQGYPPIVCVGSDRPLKWLLQGLPEKVPVWWLKLEGLHVLPFTGLSITELTTVYADELIQAISPGPLVLTGFSYGGLLAFDLLCRLRKTYGHQVYALLLEPAFPSKLCQPKSAPLRRVSSQPETLLERLNHHRRVLQTMSVVDSSSYLWSRTVATIANFTLPGLHRLYISVQLALGGTVPPEQRWFYYSPQILRSVKDYMPEIYPGEVHIAARVGWLEDYSPAWQQIIEGTLVKHVLQHAHDHQQVVGLEAATEVWLDQLSRFCGCVAKTF